MEFKHLLGKEVGFCGIDDTRVCLSYDGERHAYHVVEDPDDGYRSMLKEIVEVPLDGLIFFSRPIATVRVVSDDDIDGYQLVDVDDGHVWLRFGTEGYDDYYPTFVFDYTPPVIPEK
jgi:hypothetical protein